MLENSWALRWFSSYFGHGDSNFKLTNVLSTQTTWNITHMHYAYESFFRGEIVEIDTWVGASGKNGMRRDWLIRSQATGHVYARGTR